MTEPNVSSCSPVCAITGGEDVNQLGGCAGGVTRERQVEKTVGAVVLGEALAEVGQHAAVQAGIVQLHGQGVLEIDAPERGRTRARAHRASAWNVPAPVATVCVLQFLIGLSDRQAAVTVRCRLPSRVGSARTPSSQPSRNWPGW
ncbi:hypothetical protein ACH40E_41620 [Streptomyces acidicola]|uniref:hypothetical protein n=1 Tax=Streptomyces acidicola TaxID=2596892 RepID=UPI0037892D6E